MHQEVEQIMSYMLYRGRRDEEEEGMNIIVVGFNLNLKKREREKEDFSNNKERKRKRGFFKKQRKRKNDRDKINGGKENFLAGTENKKWREKAESTNDGQKCIGK